MRAPAFGYFIGGVEIEAASWTTRNPPPHTGSGQAAGTRSAAGQGLAGQRLAQRGLGLEELLAETVEARQFLARLGFGGLHALHVDLVRELAGLADEREHVVLHLREAVADEQLERAAIESVILALPTEEIAVMSGAWCGRMP